MNLFSEMDRALVFPHNCKCTVAEGKVFWGLLPKSRSFESRFAEKCNSYLCFGHHFFGYIFLQFFSFHSIPPPPPRLTVVEVTGRQNFCSNVGTPLRHHRHLCAPEDRVRHVLTCQRASARQGQHEHDLQGWVGTNRHCGRVVGAS